MASKIKSSEQIMFELADQVELLFASGASDSTEQILKANPQITADDELIMSLLYAEIMAAERLRLPLPEEALVARFPTLRDRIGRLVAFHETLTPDADHVPPDSPALADSAHSIQDPETPGVFRETKRDGETASPTRPTRFHRLEIDQFEILEKVGQGGMGVVYRAREKDLNRIVALKVLRNPLVDSDDRQRMLNEAQAAARLRHPGIVQIHHVGESDDQPYLCFEFIDGCHLGERLAGSTMQPRDACVLLQKVANAIAFAHEHGIIHRDLKPANILIDAKGEPKVADFGLAKFLDSSEQQSLNRLTQTGALLGTVYYMAPEQLTGIPDDVDCRADIYGLGTILYEMLGARPPLIGDTPEETIYLVRTSEPTSLRKLNPKVPRDVETICLKCLEKRPEQRFQSIVELEQELTRYLNGEPLTIRPTRWITLATRWCRRRPAVAALSGLAAFLILALGVGGYAMAWNQQQYTLRLAEQRDVAQNSTKLALEKAAEADRVTQFMINTLGSAHPNRDGRNVTVAERLFDGLRELNKSFPEDTPDKAALLRTIGKTYEGLGLYQEAQVPLKSAWQLYNQLEGEDASETLEAENQFGDLLTKLGLYEEAEGHLQHARDGLMAHPGRESKPAITAENNLAQNLFDQGRRSQALKMFAENYDIARASLSIHNPTTITTVLAYANALKSVGRFEESRELIDSVLPMAEEEFGSTHLLVISLKSTSASIDRANGKYSLALEKFLDIHDQLADKLGEDHMRTINSLSSIAIVHADLGDHVEAQKIMSLILKRMTRVLGENHPETFRAILNVARGMEENDRRNEARGLLQEAFEQASTVFGPNDPTTMMLATQYGRSLGENNQLEEAERLLTAAVEFFRDAELADPMTRAESFGNLAAFYGRTERKKQAVTLHTTALEILSGAFGEGNQKTLTAKNNLAGAYHSLDQIDDAIRLYEEILVDLRQTLGNKHLHTLITALNLAITYRDYNRSEEAARILSDVVPAFNRVAGGTWWAHTAQFQLGRAYLDIDSLDLAKHHLEAAFEGFEKRMDQQPASEKIGLANQIRRIVDQFDLHGETTTAETWRLRRKAIMESQELPTSVD